MTTKRRAPRVQGGRIVVKARLSPEQYAQLSVLQSPGEADAGVLVRALEALWAQEMGKGGGR